MFKCSLINQIILVRKQGPPLPHLCPGLFLRKSTPRITCTGCLQGTVKQGGGYLLNWISWKAVKASRCLLLHSTWACFSRGSRTLLESQVHLLLGSILPLSSTSHTFSRKTTGYKLSLDWWLITERNPGDSEPWTLPPGLSKCKVCLLSTEIPKENTEPWRS